MPFTRDDTFRFYPLAKLEANQKTAYRSEYSRDYARVLHSPSFRRLQNKTQLFPGQESDFFRNRLTHSLEVSQIARSIAQKLKRENPELEVIPEICEIAGLMHDIGHPPFGHNGEEALDECMRGYGGFEGNAQTIRVITRLEKKERVPQILDAHGGDLRVGLNLTARVIASALKYDKKIPLVRKTDENLVKGYYDSERMVINQIKSCLVENPHDLAYPFKTVECGIMDIADDIAYSTYDIEDGLKAEFLTPYDILTADHEIYEQIAEKLRKNNIDADGETCRLTLVGVFAEVWDEFIDKQKELDKSSGEFENGTINHFLMSYQRSKDLAKDGYNRTKFTSAMINYFIEGVRVDMNEDCPILSRVYFDEERMLRVNILKHFSYVVLVNSSRLKVAESRGNEIIKRMFTKLHSEKGYSLLPEDTRKLINVSGEELWRARVISDFIAGMTDRYALEFYGRLFSESPQTIFKPL